MRKRRIQIPMSDKSVRLGYIRTGVDIMVAVSGLFSCFSLFPQLSPNLDWGDQVNIPLFLRSFGICMVSLLFVYVLSYHEKFTDASYDRATELCSLLDATHPNLGSRMLRAIEDHFSTELYFRRAIATSRERNNESREEESDGIELEPMLVETTPIV